MKKVLLYSGGMDSWLINKIWKPDYRVYVNMHTQYSQTELERIKLEKDIIIIDFPLAQWERADAIIPLRNLYLVMVVCNTFPEDDLDICLGATAGDRVLDKSLEFADMTSNLLSYLYLPQHWCKGRKVRVNVDFKGMTKTDLLNEYVKLGGSLEVPLKESFSCYEPIKGRECWMCKPCFRKYVAFKSCGYQFDDEIDKKVYIYIKNEIIPQIQNGTYGRASEETEICNIFLELCNKYDKE